MFDACGISKSPDVFDAVSIALNTGMRRTEIFTLNSKQIDFKNGIITLDGVKTKSGYDREIPLNDEVYAGTGGKDPGYRGRRSRVFGGGRP